MPFKKGHKFGANTQFKKGHKVPQAWREASRKAMLGRKLSEKTKKKMGQSRKGGKNPNWKGGKRKSHNRLFTYQPNHPFATKQGYVPLSRLVAEKYLSRYLTPKEVIHHINKNTLDDRPENLYLFSTTNEHARYHFLKNKSLLTSNL